MWIWFGRLAASPPMGGAPRVDGAAFLAVCDRHGWDPEAAFALLSAILDVYRDHAEAKGD